MIRLLILCLAIFFIGCSDLTEGADTPSQFMEMSINDRNIKISSEDFVGNENCNSIFINASMDKSRIEFALTNEGFIKDVLLIDYSNNHQYRTADFKSSETFSIQNYLYNQNTKLLTFDFSGTLYDLSDEDNTISINGKINFNNLKEIACQFEPWLVQGELNDRNFSCVTILGKDYSDKTEWLGFSDSGIKLAIITSDELRDMPIGKYVFAQEDMLNVITIENYIGPNRASPIKSLNISEWENYQCEGELIIEEQIEGSKPHTKGRFTIQAFKDGELIYEVENGKFSI